MGHRLLALGECMVELSPAEDGDYCVGFAGDTFNTAWYARRIAPEATLDVAYFTTVGDDDQSARMMRFMRDAGIDVHAGMVAGGTPGLYMIFLDEGERSFGYWRSDSAARRLADHLDLLPDLAPGDVAYFSGITVAILPPEGRTALLGRLRDCAQRGVTIAFDPNLRPRLWASADDMRDWTMKAAGIARIVLPSFDDEAAVFGDTDPAATAERYLENGARIAVVKNGPGAVLVKDRDGDGFQYLPEPVENICDTTAAGDSFNAAFLVDYLERNRLREAVRAGCALARHVIAHRGALVPVTRMDLSREKTALPA
ncbi:MAG: sugar kinase [Roseibium sp.]